MTFKANEVFPILKYHHPLSKSIQRKLYPGSHVTLDAGTGLVHTAPAHGQEDYLLGLTNNLDLSCPVTELGKYDSSVNDLNTQLKGLEVLGDGNEKMLELLHEKNHIKK